MFLLTMLDILISLTLGTSGQMKFQDLAGQSRVVCCLIHKVLNFALTPFGVSQLPGSGLPQTAYDGHLADVDAELMPQTIKRIGIIVEHDCEANCEALGHVE